MLLAQCLKELFNGRSLLPNLLSRTTARLQRTGARRRRIRSDSAVFTALFTRLLIFVLVVRLSHAQHLQAKLELNVSQFLQISQCWRA